MNWPRVFGALESRNYRLYFFGQIISLIGTWMTQTASLWLVYHLTSSPLMLGVVGFVGQVPIFFLSPFAGVLADRVNRHRLLVITQILSMLQSFALAALTFTNHIDIKMLVGLTLIQGLINAVDLPVRQALVVAFVENRKHLGNAIALNSSVFNLARLVGPALSGFIIASAGVAACYFIDGLSFLAVIASLLAMRFALLPAGRVPKHPWIEMKEGFHYAFSSRPIRALLLTLALMSLVGFSYAVLTPMFARDILGGDAKTLGYLMSATGVGALLGAGYLGSRKEIRGLGNVMALGAALMGVGTIAFASSRHLVLAVPALAVIGLGGVLMMASGNTLLQSLVEEEKRGRVMSIFTMAFTGTMPLGNLAIGAMAGKSGAPFALIFSGIFCVVVAILFYRRIPELRAAAAPLMQKLAGIDPLP
ncbi:MAG: MFS transporter [Verrucomicrobiota bacterium]